MPLRPLRSREIIRKLEQTGFAFRRQKGGHARYAPPDGRGATVPMHPGDVPVPVVRYILEQAGLTEKEWETL